MHGSRRTWLALGLPVAFVIALQLVPYGRDHARPPDGQAPPWNAASTQDLARRACYDCHSNQTRWPWYASIAPLSWRIQHDVDEGREKLNLTAFEPGNEKMSEAAGEAAEEVSRGEMPPWDYLLLHPEAWLSDADRRALAGGLEATFAGYGKHGERAERHERGGEHGNERGEHHD